MVKYCLFILPVPDPDVTGCERLGNGKHKSGLWVIQQLFMNQFNAPTTEGETTMTVQ